MEKGLRIVYKIGGALIKHMLGVALSKIELLLIGASGS